MGKNLKPIKSQKEANDVKEFLINETLKVQKISREQAANVPTIGEVAELER